MDRVVFCPSEDLLEDAIKIANEWAIPIQIGDSERTKELSFDRNKVSVVLVPIDNCFSPFPAVIKPYQPAALEYYNDFVDCSKLQFLISTEHNIVIQTIPMKVIVYDKHHVSLPLFLDSEGHYKITVKLDEEQLAALHFSVTNENESDIGSYA
jgi:hypothetical protein